VAPVLAVLATPLPSHTVNDSHQCPAPCSFIVSSHAGFRQAPYAVPLERERISPERQENLIAQRAQDKNISGLPQRDRGSDRNAPPDDGFEQSDCHDDCEIHYTLQRWQCIKCIVLQGVSEFVVIRLILLLYICDFQVYVLCAQRAKDDGQLADTGAHQSGSRGRSSISGDTSVKLPTQPLSSIRLGSQRKVGTVPRTYRFASKYHQSLCARESAELQAVTQKGERT